MREDQGEKKLHVNDEETLLFLIQRLVMLIAFTCSSWNLAACFPWLLLLAYIPFLSAFGLSFTRSLKVSNRMLWAMHSGVSKWCSVRSQVRQLRSGRCVCHCRVHNTLLLCNWFTVHLRSSFLNEFIKECLLIVQTLKDRSSKLSILPLLLLIPLSICCILWRSSLLVQWCHDALGMCWG